MSLWSAIGAIFERRRTVRMTREQLEQRNLARFRDLAAFVRGRSPYYRRIIEKRGIDPARARPEDFPVLTKALLMEHYDEIATDPRITRERIERFLARSKRPAELMDGRFRVVHGSGTSGQVCYVAYTTAEWARGASQFERLIHFGFRKKVAFVGATHGHFAAVSIAEPLGWWGRLGYNVRTFDVNLPSAEMLAGVNAFQPRVLVGYGRVLRTLADAQVAGKIDIAPKAVINGGEPLRENDARRLREVFGAPNLRNAYASTEHLYMSFDEMWSAGASFLLEDDLIFELRDDCTLVTNLFNRTVPLIRHRMGDILKPPPPETSTPYGPYRLVGEVVGRYEHAPEFENEAGELDTINPHVLGEFHVPGLRQFQFHVLDRTSFRFLAVLEEGVNGNVVDGIRAGLDDLLQRKRMGNVRFDVQLAESLAHDPRTGKFRLVVLPDDGARVER